MPILTIAFHQTLIHEQTLYQLHFRHCIILPKNADRKCTPFSPLNQFLFFFLNFKVIINAASL